MGAGCSVPLLSGGRGRRGMVSVVGRGRKDLRDHAPQLLEKINVNDLYAALKASDLFSVSSLSRLLAPVLCLFCTGVAFLLSAAKHPARLPAPQLPLALTATVPCCTITTLDIFSLNTQFEQILHEDMIALVKGMSVYKFQANEKVRQRAQRAEATFVACLQLLAPSCSSRALSTR